jgi:hypothetical protein
MKTLSLTIFCLSGLFNCCLAQAGIENRYAAPIKNELLEINAQMTADRQNLYIVTAECGPRSKEAALGKRISHKNDSLVLLKVESIIHVYGYLGPKTIGYEANQTMFNVIYNMQLDSAKKYVAILWQALLKGNTTADNYAALADKVSMQESHAQIYGSIVQRKGGTYYMPPILDTVKVDSLRKQIGLPPLQEYLKMLSAK